MRMCDIDMDLSETPDLPTMYQAHFRNTHTGNAITSVKFGVRGEESRGNPCDALWVLFGDSIADDPFDARCLDLYFCHGYGATLLANEVIFKTELGLAPNYYCGMLDEAEPTYQEANAGSPHYKPAGHKRIWTRSASGRAKRVRR